MRWHDIYDELPPKGEEVFVFLENMSMIVRAELKYDHKKLIPFWHAKSWGKYYTTEVRKWMEIPCDQENESQ